MRYKGLSYVIILLGITLWLVASPVWGAPRKPRHKAQAKQEEAVPPQPAPPPAPLTLAQMPAVPPRVSYQNGQLTIMAQNSTLADILRAVHQQTGAAVDIPANATERVVTQVGPGPARDVLATLLNGSHFNYVMLGSANDSGALERVILVSKEASESEPVNQAAVTTPNPPPPPAQDQDAASDDFSDNVNGDQDQADQQQDQDQQQADQQVDQQADQQNPNGQPNVKTPEQLLIELQQRQLQQQQQQPGQPYPQAAPQGYPPIPPRPLGQPAQPPQPPQ